MRPDDLDQRLSRISTQWTLLVQAHGGSTGVSVAQAALLLRYRAAVVRYLCGAVRDGDVAEELAQEFSLRFLRGDFHRAAPERGRFRDYLRTALVHLVDDHFRARQARPMQMAENAPEPAAPDLHSADSERDFLAGWREDLLEQTWQALEQFNPAYRAALALRVGDAELTSAQIAERVTAQLGKVVSSDWVRKALQRAQKKFADLLVAEVGRSIESDEVERIEAELEALNLLRYCRTALGRLRGG